MNVYEYIQRRADTKPQSTAIRLPNGDDRSFLELDRTARCVSAWIRDRGLEPGNRVGIYLPDTPMYVPVVLGIWHAGCVATPLNTRLDDAEMAGLLDDVRPAALVGVANDKTTDSLLEDVDELDPTTALTVEPDRWIDEELYVSPAGRAPETQTDEQPAVVMHTSGSTGTPKGVVQTHRNIIAQVEGGIRRFRLTDSDVGLATVPLFHVGGFHEIILMTLFVGGSVAVQGSWDPLGWASLVEEVGATWSGLIPTMITDVLDTAAVKRRDTSSLRFCIYGGSATPEPILQSFEEEIEVNSLIDNYGLTETSGVCITYDVEEGRRPKSMGTLVPEVEAKVVDLESSQPVPTGTAGELLVRGDSVTPGYWEREDTNQQLFSDGWLHTDDVVRRTDDDYFIYINRSDGIILSGSEKIAPSEVEDALQQHPDVVAVAVLGTPHRRLGETVTAAVVTDDETLIADDIVRFYEERTSLADYKKPRRIYFLEQLPITGSHKVDKERLTEELEGEWETTE